jgi:hypothetical protein
MFRLSPFGEYVASIAIAALAALVADDLSPDFFWLKYVSFAAAVCWSFMRLRTGPAICTLVLVTLATDYLIIDPVYSLDLNGWTALALTCYFALGLLVLKFGKPRHEIT